MANQLKIGDIFGTLGLLLGYTLFITGFNDLVHREFISISSVDMMIIGAVILFVIFLSFGRVPSAFVTRRN